MIRDRDFYRGVCPPPEIFARDIENIDVSQAKIGLKGGTNAKAILKEPTGDGVFCHVICSHPMGWLPRKKGPVE